MRSLIGSINQRKGDKGSKKERPPSHPAAARQALAAGTISGPVTRGAEMTVDANAPIVRDFGVPTSHQGPDTFNTGPRRPEAIPTNPYAPTRPAMESFKDPDAFTNECRRRAQEVRLRVAAGIAAPASPDITSKPSTVSDKETTDKADRRLSGLAFLGN